MLAVALVFSAESGIKTESKANGDSLYEDRPELCTKVTKKADDNQAFFKSIHDGASSSYGYQRMKVVDAKGNPVDLNGKTGMENLLGSGATQQILESRADESKIKIKGRRKAGSALPAQYTSELPADSVKNQGEWNLCWAFAATAAAEINVLKNHTNFSSYAYTAENTDFSERHLAWFSHNSYSTDENDTAYGDGEQNAAPQTAFGGGNAFYASTCLARGSSFVPEADAPYDSTSSMKGLSEEERYSSVVLLKDWIKLGNYHAEDVETAIPALKEAIRTYGAFTCPYANNNSFYNTGTDGRFSYYSTGGNCNHEICIVGLDDNYSASNFKTAPAV